VTAAEVLDFASRDPVSRRFGFDQDELSQIERWLAATGVYWGLDGPHRAPWKLEALATGTWRAGLDRLLLGVAMSEEDGRLFGHTLPFGDVSSGEIDLVGRLAELIERLRSTLNGLSWRRARRGWLCPPWGILGRPSSSSALWMTPLRTLARPPRPARYYSTCRRRAPCSPTA
jgi:exodeoxyribonuclease V gamma subunit